MHHLSVFPDRVFAPYIRCSWPVTESGFTLSLGDPLMQARLSFLVLLFSALLLLASPAFSAGGSGPSGEGVSRLCEAAIDKAAGRYSQCLLKASARHAKRGTKARLLAQQTRCENKFDTQVARIEDRFGEDQCTPYVSEIIRQVGFVSGTSKVTIYRPLLTKRIVERFNSKHVLDVCVGWGGRMLGSVCVDGVSYTGIEPFSKTYEGLEQMKSELELTDEQVTLHNDRAETILPELEQKYDLALTSPPYYNLEIYTDEETQSHHGCYDGHRRCGARAAGRRRAGAFARGAILPLHPVFTTRTGRRATIERKAARRITRIRVRSALRLRATSCCETLCRGLPGRARLRKDGQDPIERLDYRRSAAPIGASESAGQRRPGRAGRRRGVRRRTLPCLRTIPGLRRHAAAGLEIIITEWLRRSRTVLPRLSTRCECCI